jgi:hypothetical protein
VSVPPAVGQNGTIVTPDRRLRVFVSSSVQELAVERAAASEAINGLRLSPVLFELGARPHPPRELYRAYLDQSDVFVGIYWQSYGWIASGQSISGLEDEYESSARLPRLLYVKEPAPERDSRLRAFLDRVEAEGSASYKRFGTAEELGELLACDLALVLTERFHATNGPIEPQAASGSDEPGARLPGASGGSNSRGSCPAARSPPLPERSDWARLKEVDARPTVDRSQRLHRIRKET